MSLQPGMNPLEASSMEDDRKRLERTMAAMKFRERMVDRAAQNTGGFDASDLMKDPEMAQKSTRDQANMVSAPYRQANMMAADKTNPMNAESQDPGKTFLQQYLIGPDFSTLKSPGVPILIPRRK